MARKRILIRKKKPLQDIHWLKGVTDSIHKNRKRFLVFAGGGFIVFVALVSGYLYMNVYEGRALRTFTEASILYTGDIALTEEESKPIKDYKRAVDAFKKVTLSYPKSRVVPLAYLFLGDIYFQTGELSNALDSYNVIIQSSSEDDLKTLSLYGIGKVYESMERFDDALQKYEEVSTKGGFLSGLVLKDIGMVLEKLSRLEDAKEKYSEFLDMNPETAFGNEVRYRLSRLDSGEIK